MKDCSIKLCVFLCAAGLIMLVVSFLDTSKMGLSILGCVIGFVGFSLWTISAIPLYLLIVHRYTDDEPPNWELNL